MAMRPHERGCARACTRAHVNTPSTSNGMQLSPGSIINHGSPLLPAPACPCLPAWFALPALHGAWRILSVQASKPLSCLLSVPRVQHMPISVRSTARPVCFCVTCTLHPARCRSASCRRSSASLTCCLPTLLIACTLPFHSSLVLLLSSSSLAHALMMHDDCSAHAPSIHHVSTTTAPVTVAVAHVAIFCFVQRHAPVVGSQHSHTGCVDRRSSRTRCRRST